MTTLDEKLEKERAERRAELELRVAQSKIVQARESAEAQASAVQAGSLVVEPIELLEIRSTGNPAVLSSDPSSIGLRMILPKQYDSSTYGRFNNKFNRQGNPFPNGRSINNDPEALASRVLGSIVHWDECIHNESGVFPYAETNLLNDFAKLFDGKASIYSNHSRTTAQALTNRLGPFLQKPSATKWLGGRPHKDMAIHSGGKELFDYFVMGQRKDYEGDEAYDADKVLLDGDPVLRFMEKTNWPAKGEFGTTGMETVLHDLRFRDLGAEVRDMGSTYLTPSIPRTGTVIEGSNDQWKAIQLLVLRRKTSYSNTDKFYNQFLGFTIDTNLGSVWNSGIKYRGWGYDPFIRKVMVKTDKKTGESYIDLKEFYAKLQEHIARITEVKEGVDRLDVEQTERGNKRDDILNALRNSDKDLNRFFKSHEVDYMEKAIVGDATIMNLLSKEQILGMFHAMTAGMKEKEEPTM